MRRESRMKVKAVGTKSTHDEEEEGSVMSIPGMKEGSPKHG